MEAAPSIEQFKTMFIIREIDNNLLTVDVNVDMRPNVY